MQIPTCYTATIHSQLILTRHLLCTHSPGRENTMPMPATKTYNTRTVPLPPNQPGCDGYVGLQMTNSNNLVDQAINKEALPLARLPRQLNLLNPVTGMSSSRQFSSGCYVPHKSMNLTLNLKLALLSLNTKIGKISVIYLKANA